MVGLVNAAEVLSVHVGVDLRGRQVRMAQHFLHGAQVRPSLEEVRGKRVPQRVWADPLLDACPARAALPVLRHLLEVVVLARGLPLHYLMFILICVSH